MASNKAGKSSEMPRTFLGRLARDVRGNTLAIMAIALLPLSALAGSGLDTARMYVVKVRLQQACDAGVLAGRKFMDTSGSTSLDANATTQANTFFANNFKAGWMQTYGVSFKPVKTADQQVSGTASASMPMSVMKMFGAGDQTINVQCEARYDVADTDVMFVLDTTGSMACSTANDNGGGCGASTVSYTRPDGTTGYHAVEQSGSKISGLRAAVLNFYDTVAGTADASTHIRYGFVTYTSTVNAGYAITAVSPSYMVSAWNYQTRKVVGDANNGNASSSTQTGVGQTSCTNKAGRSPTAGYNTNGTATVTTTSWASGSGGSCTITAQPVRPMWRYGQWPLDVSQYITGATVADPSKITGATSKWQGCIEERDTTASSSFDVNNLPLDLDPDAVPTADPGRWRPMWPDVIYYRGSTMGTLDDSGNQSNPYGDSSNYPNWASPTYLSAGYVSCGKPVQRLAVMTRSDVSNYVNASDFVPQGGTYHDTGMIWGTRLISPTGIFAGDTSAWPGRNAPNRYIVFMTDGQMAPNQYIYGMYGMEYYDRRVTNGNYSNDTAYHNSRFVAECQAAKKRNIRVFVIGFGQALTPELTSCASKPADAFYASDNASLTTAFQNIAKQVAMLRISQ